MSDVRSRRKWGYVLAETALLGCMDEELVFDSLGREFMYKEITLYNPPLIRSFIGLADHLFIPPKRTDYSLCRLEATMELKKTHTLETFKARIRQICADHPNWRSGVSRAELEDELQDIIRTAKSVRHLIKTMIYLEDPREPRGKKSKITIDRRTVRRPY